jgi:hypothetical protein
MRTILTLPLTKIDSGDNEAYLMISGTGDRIDSIDRISLAKLKYLVTASLQARIADVEAKLVISPDSDDLASRLDTVEAQLEQTTALPTGAIILWSGKHTNIPEGWALCDGDNDTPDLTGRFVMGANAYRPAGTKGGNILNSSPVAVQDTIPGTEHSSRTVGGEGKQLHVPMPDQMLPPYYALCYIMRV